MSNTNRVGTPNTVGRLKDMISKYPNSTSFGFRNQPIQTLFEVTHGLETFVVFDYPEHSVVPKESSSEEVTPVNKCYIAGKIGGLHEAEYKANFEEAKAQVKAFGWEPVSPLDLPHAHGRSWEEYMREDLIALLECGSLYALRNWRQSPGALIEVNMACSVGIEIIFQTPIKVIKQACGMESNFE